MTATKSVSRESNFSWWIAVILLLLVSFAARIHLSTTLGTQSDEGLHIAIAERIAIGDKLYAELFENRTPLVEWTLALAFSVAGTSVFMSRIITIMVSSFSIAGLILGGRILYRILFSSHARKGVWIGLAAGTMFAIAPLAIFWGRYVMLEHWQTFASLLAICCAMLATIKQPSKWWLLSGLFAGIAILSKQSGVVVTIAIMSYLILLRLTNSILSFPSSFLVWLAGLLLPLLLTALFLLFQGSLDDFLGFVSGVDRLDPILGLETKLSEFGSWSIRQPVVFLAIVGSFAILGQRNPLALLPVFWVFGEVVALFLPPELDLNWGGFSHYSITAIASISLCGAFGITWIVESIRISRPRRIFAYLFLLLTLMIGVNGFRDLQFALWQTTYPQPDVIAEQEIGVTTKKFTGEDSSILVFGNSIFYHWANAQPANLYLHYPAYLPSSSLAERSESNLVETLSDSDASAVLVSRMYLDERLSNEIKQSLFDHWEPVAHMTYPYQGDIFLFVPADRTRSPTENLAVFGQGIYLLEIQQINLNEKEKAIRLVWRTTNPLDNDLTVFVHLLDSEGNLVAQHDGIPSIGFRPTNSWQTGELIPDWHIISIPSDLDWEGFNLVVGMYDSISGERIILQNVEGQDDSYIIDWKES